MKKFEKPNIINAENEEVLFVVNKEKAQRILYTITGILCLAGVYISLFHADIVSNVGGKIAPYFVIEEKKEAPKRVIQPRNYETMIGHISKISGWNQELIEGLEVATEHSKMLEDYQRKVTSYEGGDNFDELIQKVSEPSYKSEDEEGDFKTVRVTWRKLIAKRLVIVITVVYEKESRQIIDKNFSWETI